MPFYQGTAIAECERNREYCTVRPCYPGMNRPRCGQRGLPHPAATAADWGPLFGHGSGIGLPLLVAQEEPSPNRDKKDR